MKERIIYCPAHFGNFYECASYNELRSYFKEFKKWGATGIGTWVDPANMADPFGKNPLYRWAREKPIEELKRKRDLLCAAKDEGLKLSLALTPNVVYIDQLSEELAADTGKEGYIGPNLCPSKPEAIKIILQNQENILRFLKEEGLSLNYILASPRDYGGCACEKCSPWIKTYLSFFEKIVPFILKYHPEAKVQFLTWWVNQEEIEIIASYLKEKNPEWVEGLNLSLGYTKNVPEIKPPSPYQKTIFLHISYASTHQDKYGVKGGVVAPDRLEEIFKKMPSDITGFQAYSEGIYDDLNKYLSCQLGKNPNLNGGDLVDKYCQNYFHLKGRDSERLVGAIYDLEYIEENKEKGSLISQVFEEIEEKYNLSHNWRFLLLSIRAKVSKIEFKIGDEERWDKETKELTPEEVKEYIKKVDYLIGKRRTILEDLERKVYRIGAQCHGLNIDKDYQIWQRWKRGVKEEKESFSGSGDYVL